ncbi:MAG: hypothetical protein AAF665_12055 [Pseudomonadota bacterium]
MNQISYIGDGADLASNPQKFLVPMGAARLFLGTSDIYGWFNNEGSVDLTVTNTSAVLTPPNMRMSRFRRQGDCSLRALAEKPMFAAAAQ